MIHFQKSASNVVKKASNVVKKVCIVVKKETRRRSGRDRAALALVGGFVSLNCFVRQPHGDVMSTLWHAQSLVVRNTYLR